MCLSCCLIQFTYFDSSEVVLMPKSLIDRCVRMLTVFFSILEMSFLILLSLLLILFCVRFQEGDRNVCMGDSNGLFNYLFYTCLGLDL